MEELKLWKHQEDALRKASAGFYFGLFFSMGTGKTRTSIEIMRSWYRQRGRVMKTLILGPPIVVRNWQREIEKYSKVGPYVTCLEGTGQQRIKLFKAKMHEPQIFITNYESLLMKELSELLDKWIPEVIIFDESHRLKNMKAKRTKVAIKLSDWATYKLILTGTPILNTPMDIFSQMRILDGGQTFGKNFYLFRGMYFYDKNAGMPSQKHFPDFQPRPGSLEMLQEKIAALTSVVQKEDCLDLPPLIRKTIYVTLSNEQRKLYESVKKDFIAYVGDKACVAELAITKALRLQQIVSGFISLTDEAGTENVTLKDNPRLEALAELLLEITAGHKCLVWAVFRENYRAVRGVCERLGLKYVEVHGEVSPRVRQAAVDQFNADPEIKVFLGHPGSAGIGINLVAASYSIFYSRSFSLEQDLQAEARNYRGGSEIHEKITRIDLVAEGTIDELVLKALASKQAISNKILLDIAKDL